MTVGSTLACQALIDLVKGIFKSKPTNKKSNGHEEDLVMWEHVLTAILRVDCALTYLMEEPKQITINTNNLLVIDTTSLVDFNKI